MFFKLKKCLLGPKKIIYSPIEKNPFTYRITDRFELLRFKKKIWKKTGKGKRLYLQWLSCVWVSFASLSNIFYISYDTARYGVVGPTSKAAEVLPSVSKFIKL